jgi:hypothetical protein
MNAAIERMALYARTSTHDQNPGIHVGRPPARVDTVKATGLLAGGQSLRQMARVLGIGVSTFHRALQAGQADSNVAGCPAQSGRNRRGGVMAGSRTGNGRSWRARGQLVYCSPTEAAWTWTV